MRNRFTFAKHRGARVARGPKEMGHPQRLRNWRLLGVQLAPGEIFQRKHLFTHGLRRLNEDRVNAKLLQIAVHYAAPLEESGGLCHQSQLLIEDRLPKTAHTRDPALFLYHTVVY